MSAKVSITLDKEILEFVDREGGGDCLRIRSGFRVVK
jgi:hypothetical protein